MLAPTAFLLFKSITHDCSLTRSRVAFSSSYPLAHDPWSDHISRNVSSRPICITHFCTNAAYEEEKGAILRKRLLVVAGMRHDHPNLSVSTWIPFSTAIPSVEYRIQPPEAS